MQSIFRLFLCFALFSSYFCGLTEKVGRARRGSQTPSPKASNELVYRNTKLDKKATKEVQSSEKSVFKKKLKELMDCEFEFKGLLRTVELELIEKQSKKKSNSGKLSLASSKMETPSLTTLAEAGQQRSAQEHEVWTCGSLRFTRDEFLTLLREIVSERESLLRKGKPWKKNAIYRTLDLKSQFENFFVYTYEFFKSKDPENFVPSVVVYSTRKQMLMSCNDKEICLYRDMFRNKKDASLAYLLIQNMLKYKGSLIYATAKIIFSFNPEEYEKFKPFSTQDLINHSSRCSEAIAEMTLPKDTPKIELNSQCKDYIQALKQRGGEFGLDDTKSEIYLFTKPFKQSIVLSSILQGVLIKLGAQFDKNKLNHLEHHNIIFPNWFIETIKMLKDFQPKGEDFVNDDGYPVLKLLLSLEEKKV